MVQVVCLKLASAASFNLCLSFSHAIEQPQVCMFAAAIGIEQHLIALSTPCVIARTPQLWRIGAGWGHGTSAQHSHAALRISGPQCWRRGASAPGGAQPWWWLAFCGVKW